MTSAGVFCLYKNEEPGEFQTRHPKTKIYLAANGSGAVSALFAAGNLGRDLDTIIIAGADSGQLHAYNHSAVKIPVLMLHQKQCPINPPPSINRKNT